MSGAVIAAICAAAQRLVTLVADMGLAATYNSYKEGPTNQTCSLTVTWNPDGTWAVTTSIGAELTGTPLSGSWGTPTTPGAGANYELLVVDNTGAGGGGTSINGANVYTDLSVARALTLSISDSTLNDGSESATRSYTATVRRIGTTTPVSTDTFTLNPQANKSDV